MSKQNTPKIFFTDLDGTLLTTEKKVSPSTKQALKDLKITLLNSRHN